MDLADILYTTDRDLDNFAEHISHLDDEDRKEQILDILHTLRVKAIALSYYEENEEEEEDFDNYNEVDGDPPSQGE